MKSWTTLGAIAVAIAIGGTASAQTVGMGVGVAGFWTNSAGAACKLNLSNCRNGSNTKV